MLAPQSKLIISKATKVQTGVFSDRTVGILKASVHQNFIALALLWQQLQWVRLIFLSISVTPERFRKATCRSLSIPNQH